MLCLSTSSFSAPITRPEASSPKVSSPIVVTWFATLATLGLLSILKTSAIIAATDPRYTLHLFVTHPTMAFVIFGAVFLCVIGGEALYAGLGHFGRKAITSGWLLIV